MQGRITVLLVEDDHPDVVLLTRAIREHCQQTTIQHVTNGEEAIQYLKGDPPFEDRERFPFPDVLLTDVKMPRMDGFKLLAWTQANEQFRVVPSIVLSASDDPSDISKAYRLGANTYFVKPASYDELVSLVEIMGAYWHRSALPTSHENRHRAVALSMS